jgi:hypothetical protein
LKAELQAAARVWTLRNTKGKNSDVQRYDKKHNLKAAYIERVVVLTKIATRSNAEIAAAKPAVILRFAGIAN